MKAHSTMAEKRYTGDLIHKGENKARMLFTFLCCEGVDTSAVVSNTPTTEGES